MLVHIVNCTTYSTKVLPEDSLNVRNLLEEICLENVKESFYVVCNGKKVNNDSKVEDGKTYHIIPRLPGGKGGFGSMLRAIGAQIEKTTSREACRDLSGRRMRDINNEKKLKEWLAKEAERERDREQRRQERLAKQQAQPQHKFDDTEYYEQRAKMQEDLQDALSKGLKRTHKKDRHHCADKKMKPTSSGTSNTEWIGVDIDTDDSASSSDNEANPGPPDLQHERNGSCSKDHSGSSTSSSSSPQQQTDNNDVKADSYSDSQAEGTSQQMLSQNHISKAVKEADNSPIVNKTKVKDNWTTMKVSENESNSNSDQLIDLNDYSSSKDLAKLGLERLKNALLERGLKCGGTLEERAERLFSIKGLEPDQIDPSLFAKSKGKGKRLK